MKKKITIGIIGYGRFGKLWASCLTRFGTVFVYDKRGLPAILPRGIKAATLSQVVDVTMLFLLVPISQIESCCKEIAPLLQKHTIVLDACSVKLYPTKFMKKNLPTNQPVIATHPLFGPDSSKNGVIGKKIVFSPLRASRGQIALCKKILRSLGLIVLHTTPSQHDRAMARSQALVHLIGRSLKPLRLQSQEISTPDYASLLAMQAMVQNDSWQLFLDMQNYNPYTKSIRKKFLQKLMSIEKSLTL